MAPVPAFDSRGYLPPFQGADEATRDRSPYQVTMVELVQAMAKTAARQKLLKGLVNYRMLLTSLGYTQGMQFIDGSFVENIERLEKRDPRDIDVFSFLVRPSHYQTDRQRWNTIGWGEWISKIANARGNKVTFGIDTYAIAIGSASSPRHN